MMSSNTMSFDVQVGVPQTPCPKQSLLMVTKAENNQTVHGMFPKFSTVYLNGLKTSVEISAPGLPAGGHYHSNFSIKDDNGGIVDTGETVVPFSKYTV